MRHWGGGARTIARFVWPWVVEPRLHKMKIVLPFIFPGSLVIFLIVISNLILTLSFILLLLHFGLWDPFFLPSFWIWPAREGIGGAQIINMKAQEIIGALKEKVGKILRSHFGQGTNYFAGLHIYYLVAPEQWK